LSERIALYTLLRNSPLATNVLAVLRSSTARTSAADRKSLRDLRLIAWGRKGPYLTDLGRMVAIIKLHDDAIQLRVHGALFEPRQYPPNGIMVRDSTA
jgi:hypothetical protein